MHGAIRIQTRQAIPKRQWRLGTGRAQADKIAARGLGGKIFKGNVYKGMIYKNMSLQGLSSHGV